MAYVIINDKHLKAIADVLRKYNDKLTYKPREMAEAIDILGSDGGNHGGLTGKYIIGVDVPGAAFEVLVKDCIEEDGSYFMPDGMWEDKNIVGPIIIPYGLKEIPDEGLKDTLGITDITFAPELRTIGDYAFYNALDMADRVLVIGIDVEAIGDYSFANNEIGEIELNTTLTSIGNYAFANNPNLTKCNGKLDSVPEGIFDECTSLTHVEIGDKAESIGDYAFRNCGLTNIIFNENLRAIGKYAFMSCTDLLELNLSSNIETIGEGAFSGCAFTEVELNKRLQSIGAYAFAGNENLLTVTFNEGLTDIEHHAFNNCTALKDIVFPSTLQRISYNAFAVDYWNAGYIVNVTFNEGLTSIGDHAFANKNIVFDSLPSTLTNVGTRAFYRNNSLTSVEIPSGITEIKRETFLNCYSLNTVTLNEGLLEISAQAFGGTKVYELICPSSLKRFNPNAFYSDATTARRLRRLEFDLSKNGLTFDNTSSYPLVMSTPNSTLNNYITFKGQNGYKATTSSAYNRDFFSHESVNNEYTTISVPWDQSENPNGFPWGATNATIIYNNGL